LAFSFSSRADYSISFAVCAGCNQAGRGVITESLYLVTGATDGIGKATALALAGSGAAVILHGRDAQKTARAVAEIQAATGNDRLQTVLADFASLDEVAALADRVRGDFPGLAVLINNAGLLTDHRRVSQDGYELTFAVNYLAPFLLTHRLLDLLKANAPARIVNVASTAMGGAAIDLSDLQAERRFDGWQAYANSKLANILFSNLLAEKLAGTGVVSNALCPGLIDTNFFHTNTLFANGGYERLQPGMRTPEEGALVPLYLAASDEAAGFSGEFFVRVGRDGRRAVPLNWDRDLAEGLWSRSCEYLGDRLAPL
jgi:NAD(P)-dependent dehydrogenase (short-subunit alcohol dehydrogenase family)